MTKLITITTGLLTLALAAISFILSFNALTDLARQHGVSIPPLFPFVVEAAVIVFSVAMLYWSLQDERTRWLWTLIIFSSVIAGTFNVVHAQPDIVSRSMAAMPSLFLLLSFETFLSLVKHRARVNVTVQTLAGLTEQFEQRKVEIASHLEARQQEAEQVSVEIEQAHRTLERLQAEQRGISERLQGSQPVKLAVLNGQKAVDKQEAMNRLLTFYRSNPLASLNDAGQAIGRSKSTVSNYLNELQEAGTVYINGNGVEVLGA